jgi:hypothetical protein
VPEVGTVPIGLHTGGQYAAGLRDGQSSAPRNPGSMAG